MGLGDLQGRAGPGRAGTTSSAWPLPKPSPAPLRAGPWTISLVTISPLAPILQSQTGPSRFVSPYITASTATEDPRTVSCPPMCSSSRRQARRDALHVPGVGCCRLHRADPAYCGPLQKQGNAPWLCRLTTGSFSFCPPLSLCRDLSPASKTSLLPQMNTNHIQIKRLETKCGLLSST